VSDPDVPTPEQIRDYLLRRLQEPERSRFEQAYFSDDGLLDRVEAEEDRLVSDYVLGKLQDSDRRRFELALLGTPYYQERVETTSRLNLKLSGLPALAKRTPPTGPTKARLFPGSIGLWIALGLTGILLVASLASAMQLRRALEKAEARAAEAETRVARLPATVVLGLDGSGIRRVERQAGSPIQVVVPATLLRDASGSYAVTVRDATGSLVFRTATPAASGADVSVWLPASVQPGTYALELWAGEPDGPPLGRASIEIPR
jgi:anti-sigma-K factor RskA